MFTAKEIFLEMNLVAPKRFYLKYSKFSKIYKSLLVLSIVWFK